MTRVPGRAKDPLVLALAILAGACGGPGTQDHPSPPPSGSLGPVTQEAAGEAILGLCEIVGPTDPGAAATTFFDRSHQTLHVIAAATEVVDREAAAALLEAKQVIEADLGQPALPEGFSADSGALLEATRAALASIGLDAPACPD